jgi:FdhE protein
VVHSPRVVLPRGATLFADRVARLNQLANGHSMGDYLRLMAEIARAQAMAFGAREAPSVAATAIASARAYGMPPIAATSHVRDASWLGDLHDILTCLDAAPGARVARSTVAALAARGAADLAEAADRLLAGSALDSEAAEVPFIGAALQVYFTRLAETLPMATLESCDVPMICPACASRPVASVVRIDPERSQLRYLCCSLCHTEWNLARIKCSSCEGDKGLQYFGLEAQPGQANKPAWRAEACDECMSYLKIFYQEKDPQVDPIADDLASLALDLLVDERGYARSGPNVLFHPGSG